LVHCPTGLDKIQALRKCRHGRSVCGIVEHLEAVSVVGCHDRIERYLDFGINTGVDQAKRLDSQWCSTKITRVDKVILLVEVVGKGGYPMSSVRLAPDAELLFVARIARETMHLSAATE
jgi:hypothetical protein